MLFYTHVWDLLLKCPTFCATPIILIAAHDRVFCINADAAIPIIFVGAALGFLIYRQLVSILASWLYARINLRVPVSFSDAKQLRTLFQLHVGGGQAPGWLPMKEVKQLPIHERRAALLTEVERVRAQGRLMLY